MKYNSAITKSELLVTLACITLAVLNLGGLGSAGRERARRMVCAANMAQLMRANHLYADNWDEQFCPAMMQDVSMPSAERKKQWLMNNDFRKYTGLDEKQVGGNEGIIPKEYQCPTDILSKVKADYPYGMLVSYAYNVSDWNGATSGADHSRDFSCYTFGSYCNPQPWQISHKRTAVAQPSKKINFAESCDWWCTWWGADYEDGWDRVGQETWQAYDAEGVYGPVLYRHREGTNLAFYDGHVEYKRKQQVYIDTGTGDPPDRDGSGLWFVLPWP